MIRMILVFYDFRVPEVQIDSRLANLASAAEGANPWLTLDA